MTKTNIRKRAISILLIFMVMLTMTPMTASAAEPVWTTVSTFDELYTAVKDKKEYIQLGRDISTSSLNYSVGMLRKDILIFRGENTVLDLNGNTLNLNSRLNDVYFFICLEGGSLTIKDSSPAKNGKISGSFGSTTGGKFYRSIDVCRSGSLTLEGGTFSVNGSPYPSTTNTICCSKGSVTVKDGVTISHPEFFDRGYARDLDGDGYALLTEERSKAIIEGGTFDGGVKLTGYQDTNGSVQINGGTFKNVVQLMYAATENNPNPAVIVNDGTFENNVYLQGWPWRTSLYMPHRLNGGTIYGSLDLCADDFITDKDKPEGNLNIALGLDKCFGYNAVSKHDGVFTGSNIHNAIDWKTVKQEYRTDYYMVLKGDKSNPIRIIPNAWGMESVTLDDNPINYAKDWKGGFEELNNDKAHTLKYTWKPLASGLSTAGYSYRAECDRYLSGSTTPTTDTISDGVTEYSYTIPAGADPKVYSFALHLNLKKGDDSVGIFSNEHIVKLVLNEAPAAPPTLSGKVYYTSGIVYGHSISTAASVTPAEATKSCQWQRSTDGGSTWTNIEGATSGKYTPVAADMGENVRIRVKITAEGYLGEIVGAPVKVSKAANNNTPAPPAVEAQKDSSGAYTKFVISEFNSSNQEYVYTTSAPTSGNEWPSGTPITSDTVENLTAGSTYYIYTRYKETDTHTAGSKISSSSVLLDDETKLNRIILTDASGKEYSSYGNGNTIYIQKGTSMTLNVTKNPVGANKWSAFTFKSQSGASALFSVTAPTGSVTSGSTISSVTIHGDNAGTDILVAEYSGFTSQYYGTWRIHVYDNVSDIGTAAEITVSTSFPDTTMYVGDTMTLPAYTVTAYPEGALDNYNLAWRIIKTGMGATYPTSNDNITLEDGKIKAEAAHTGGEKTLLGLVAIDKTDSTKIISLSPTSRFYVTVTEAPTIALTGITVAPTKVNLEIGDTITLSAVKEPVNAEGSLTWASDKPAVAEVDTTGKVTARAQGTAKITATCGSESASCTVTVHTHDTDAQSWVYMDPGTHIKTCSAGDDFKMEAHDFSAWAEVNGTNNHSRTCSKCKDPIAKSINYSETAAHTWVWVVDTPAAAGVAGVKHEKCTGCNATRKVGTVIPALPNHTASGGGSYAPTTQKPEITIIGSGKAELSADGKTATITAATGYELTSVVLNGKEMGKVEKLTGLKTGDKVTITFRAKAGEKDGKEETDKMIAREVSKLRLTARSARTAKKNVKLVVKSDLKAITDAGYTVKYKFYRSTKKSAGYKAVLTKKAPTYVNTYGKKGTLYYYKVKVMVYDKDGNLTAQSALKQCKYASRLWTK